MPLHPLLPLAGDTPVPHEALGDARRMEVVDRDHQHDTLLQAVQNHGPQVVMVDEIGNKEVSVRPDNSLLLFLKSSLESSDLQFKTYTLQDVRAVRSITHRGVSMVATAHGADLSSLMSNSELVPLLGGIKVWRCCKAFC
jgi:stage III sporulation protein SpoIIIAA